MSDADKHADIVRLTRVTTTEKAYIIQQALEREGIFVRLVGDNLEAGFGDLPTVGSELWVRKQDYDKAREFLEQHEKSGGVEDEEGT